MIVGVPRETFPGERRVALVPAVIPNLAKAGLEVVVEPGAGFEAGYPDAEFRFQFREPRKACRNLIGRQGRDGKQKTVVLSSTNSNI